MGQGTLPHLTVSCCHTIGDGAVGGDCGYTINSLVTDETKHVYKFYQMIYKKDMKCNQLQCW